MRKLITGVDDDGRSCVVRATTLELHPAPYNSGFRTAGVFLTRDSPPPSRPLGRGPSADIHLAPGLVSWTVVEYEPHATFSLHHTDSIDFDLVLAGSIELLLDDGAHLLEGGDCVVVTGVDHGWTAGPDGCRVSVLAIGTAPYHTPLNGGPLE
jgi:hypothetical protein